jgi:hypothetical protein
VERSVQLRVGPVVVMVTQAFEERGQSALNLAVVNKVGYAQRNDYEPSNP